MNTPVYIAAAGNIEVPCYLALRELGFIVSREWIGNDPNDELWHAKREEVCLSARNPVELLGLVKLFELQGSTWMAEDAEIEAFMSQFYPDLLG